MKKPNILLYYNAFSTDHIGGSEFRILTAIELLRGSCSLTLVTKRKPDWEKLNALYGKSIQETDVLVILYPKIKGIYLPGKFRRTALLRQLGAEFDLCISCSNMIDFDVPGIHFIFLSNFDPEFKAFYWKHRHSVGAFLFYWGLVFPYEQTSRILSGYFRSVRTLICDSKERIFANSEAIADSMQAFYRIDRPEVLYPPVLLEFDDEQHLKNIERKQTLPLRGNLDVLSIGRISKDKQVDVMIEILRRVRAKGYPELRFHLGGSIPKNAYGRKIRRLIDRNSWIIAEGLVFGDRKKELLSRCPLAVHARRNEEFGISVAEYLKAGIVPIVPNCGGPGEIVELPELKFESIDEAVEKIIALIENPPLLKKCRDFLEKKSKIYSADQFVLNFQRIIDEELRKKGFSDGFSSTVFLSKNKE